MDPMRTSQIDLTYLSEIAGDDLEFQRDVLLAYAEGVEPLLSEFRDAASRGDRKVAYRVAHSLKGSSRSIGAYPFADFCEQVESRVQEEPLDAILDELTIRVQFVLDECNDIVRS
jgi:HPt (histidine-containing phosphotransfer) domain-containing protein